MAFNIMDLFRSAPVAPQGQPAQGIPGNPTMPGPSGVQNPGALPGTQNSSVTAVNGVVPVSAPAPAPSLMEGFKDVWQTVPDDPTKKDTSAFANLDPAKVMESAKNVDFTKVLTPDLLAKIAAGGQEAVVALSQAMQLTSQDVYGRGAITTAKIVEQALEKQRKDFEAALPNLVRQHAVTDSLRHENPMLNDPAIQPMVQALQHMLTMKHPNASSAEIKKNVNEYFDALGAAFAPKTPQSEAAKKGSDVYDFGLFLPKE